MQAEQPTRAACLTPAGAGGIAVVQVIGRRAADALRPHLQADRPIDLESLVPDRLRLCRIVEGEQVIDDAVVAARRDERGRLIVEVNLHGGPRVVQRVLLLLKQAGAQIVGGGDWPSILHAGRPVLEREAAEALLRVKTRAVAAWLARTVERLPAEVGAMLADLAAGRVDEVRARLADRCAAGQRARYLLDGVRVVLVGRPNTGKSTLANRLGGRDLALVSEQPGTTRDWTEHPGAIAGVPFTFVDTAGIRPTADPIEQEAIRRSHAQVAPADILVQVIDGSRPPHDDDRQAIERARGRDTPPLVFAWNKTDLGIHPEQTRFLEGVRKSGVTLSALTGEGLDALRVHLIAVLGLRNWPATEGAPFNDRQLTGYRDAEAALWSDRINPAEAAGRLKSVTSAQPPEEDD